MTVVIELPVLPPPVDELWHTLLDLGDQLDVPWALIGGQMVLLHAIEHGRVPPQVSQDGDVIADIRAVPDALTQVVAGLECMGFGLQSISADGLAHRYTRAAEPRPVVIDVLAPEGLGERADLTTTHWHDSEADPAGRDRRQVGSDSAAWPGASLPRPRAALCTRRRPVRTRRADDP
jgi:hypothetical protein